jgi:8-oxo-dGTP pyrophosphatase MutT (NUDIX family)
VRVLLIDEDERVLLFRGEHPGSRAAFWFPAGGGIEDGEDPRETAVREVAEETGLRDLVLGPEVWHRRHVFSWRGVEWDQDERWFLARVEHFEPVFDSLSETERDDFTGWRWWSVEQLEATDDGLIPSDLDARLRTLLRDGAPPEPIEIGA